MIHAMVWLQYGFYHFNCELTSPRKCFWCHEFKCKNICNAELELSIVEDKGKFLLGIIDIRWKKHLHICSTNLWLVWNIDHCMVVVWSNWFYITLRQWNAVKNWTYLAISSLLLTIITAVSILFSIFVFLAWLHGIIFILFSEGNASCLPVEGNLSGKQLSLLCSNFLMCSWSIQCIGIMSMVNSQNDSGLKKHFGSIERKYFSISCVLLYWWWLLFFLTDLSWNFIPELSKLEIYWTYP